MDSCSRISHLGEGNLLVKVMKKLPGLHAGARGERLHERLIKASRVGKAQVSITPIELGDISVRESYL